jgi:hypothetical protein
VTINVRQRADLTHKYNRTSGRHGWLRLTPAYSVKIVDEIIAQWPPETRILDPFSGTATTPLCAVSQGYAATAIDINPFLIWLGRTKVALYQEREINESWQIADQILDSISFVKKSDEALPLPPLYNIERWWDRNALRFLSRLKASIDTYSENGSAIQNLLLIAFCRTMMSLSNASFDHQSMSFKATEDSNCLQMSFYEVDATHEFARLFRQDVENVLQSAAINPDAQAEIIAGDSRSLEQCLTQTYDLVVTSPPYPNRMLYIRELRPYMYWLGYLKDAREAGELDWQAIGGTWGIATSRLLQWERPGDIYSPPYFSDIIARIASAENANGQLLARYVEKYFADMWLHLKGAVSPLASGGEVHYIVGNSTFYHVLLPVEQMYRDMLLELGLTDVAIKVLRKRNSKKELFEYEISGRKR